MDNSGLGERLDDHPYRLSYGQKRRLNLISVLAYTPGLILLDEVLIGQDPENAAFLLELLRKRAAAGDAVIMVNHAPRVTRSYASRLVFFNEGKVTVDAPPGVAFAQLEALGMEVFVPPPEVQTMRMRITYQPGSSLLHRLHPLVKAAWLIAGTVFVFAVRSPWLVVASVALLLLCLPGQRAAPGRDPRHTPLCHDRPDAGPSCKSCSSRKERPLLALGPLTVISRRVSRPGSMWLAAFSVSSC